MSERVSTFNQNRCIGNFTNLKVWECEPKLTFDEASNMVATIKDGSANQAEMIEWLQKHRGNPAEWKKGSGGTPSNKPNWQAVYNEAYAAGMAAGKEKTPVPMSVVQRANPLDDTSPVVKAYEPVASGVCGFAWVWFKGNSSFGRWATKKKLTMNGYPTGKQIWVSEFGQSMEKKMAFAAAFAEVLRKHGVECSVGSRMD